MERPFRRAAPRRFVFAIASSLLLSACACWPGAGPAAMPPPSVSQTQTFGPLARLAGRTWRSEPADGQQAGPADVSAWSWDLGGTVLVNRHALEDGSYGGINYIYENGQTGSLEYVYVNSGGFHTTGTFVLGEDGSWTAEEEVTGHDTITRVRSTGRFTDGGDFAMTSEYFANGEWMPGRNVVYTPVQAEIPVITGPPAE